MWRGYDLHCVSDRHNKFYRIIHCNGVVVIRFGRRGSEGQRIIKVMSNGGAESFVENQHYDKIRGVGKRNGERYDEVHRDYSNTVPEGIIIPNPWIGDGEDVADSIETAYLSRWRNSTRINDDSGVYQWAVFSQLLASAKGDLVASFVLEELTSSPHAIDAGRDLVMGQVRGYERARAAWSWVTVLGDGDSGDSNAIANTALGLYRPDNPAKDRIFPTARRLVSAQ